MHVGIQIALVVVGTILGAVLATTLDYVKSPAKKEETAKEEVSAKEEEK